MTGKKVYYVWTSYSTALLIFFLFATYFSVDLLSLLGYFPYPPLAWSSMLFLFYQSWRIVGSNSGGGADSQQQKKVQRLFK